MQKVRKKKRGWSTGGGGWRPIIRHAKIMEPREESVEDADCAGLPNRLLRKAETAIQGRTSRILAVIERCTDEHNYSAVIRTAEALGVQHIWLVDPVDVSSMRGEKEVWRPQTHAKKWESRIMPKTHLDMARRE